MRPLTVISSHRARAGRPGAALAVILALVALSLIAAAGRLAWEKRELDATQEAIRQAGPAATQAAQDISSYDYRTLDSDLRTATGHTTGAFREKFEAETARVRSQAPRQQIMVTGTAVKTGIETASVDRIVALVYLNQETVRATDVAKGDRAQRLPSQFTLRMTMKRIGERWLVSEVEVL